VSSSSFINLINQRHDHHQSSSIVINQLINHPVPSDIVIDIVINHSNGIAIITNNTIIMSDTTSLHSEQRCFQPQEHSHMNT
jgi:hypothetical protein